MSERLAEAAAREGGAWHRWRAEAAAPHQRSRKWLSGARSSMGLGRGACARVGEDDGIDDGTELVRAHGAPRCTAAAGGKLTGSGALVLDCANGEAEEEGDSSANAEGRSMRRCRDWGGARHCNVRHGTAALALANNCRGAGAGEGGERSRRRCLLLAFLSAITRNG